MSKISKLWQVALLLATAVRLNADNIVPGSTPDIINPAIAFYGTNSYDNTRKSPGVTVIQYSISSLETSNAISLLQAGINSTLSNAAAATSAGSDQAMSAWVLMNEGGFRDTTSNVANSGLTHSIMLGAGYVINQMLSAGLGASYNISNITTTFNRGQVKATNFGVNPYIMYSFNPCFNVQAMGGYNSGKSKSTRNWSSVEIVHDIFFNDTFSANPTVNSMFGAFFVNGQNSFGATTLSAQLGYVAYQTKIKAFTETPTQAIHSVYANTTTALTYKLQTLTTQLKAAYAWNAFATPYILVNYGFDIKARKNIWWENAAKNEDLTQQTETYALGRHSWGLGTGVTFAQSDQLSGSFGVAFNKRGGAYTGINATFGITAKF